MVLPSQVTGFVPIYKERGGFEHLKGTTLRMRWPGTAESLLVELASSGYCLSWRPADPGLGEPVDYRGARVFSCRRARPGAVEQSRGAQLIAIWESL